MVTELPEYYKVLFVDTMDDIIADQPGTIFISPSKRSWNDFGARILIDIEIHSKRDEDRESFRFGLPGFFGFVGKEGERSDTTVLRDAIVAAAGSAVSSESLPAFFTMLPEMAAYRRIVESLGPDEARLALHAMNDMVEADDTPAGKTWLRTARNSKVFLNSFLRNSGAYFTWKNAAPLLQGLDNEMFGEISPAVRIRFELAGRPGEHDLTFRFSQADDNLPRRFAVVIGKNGVGKSQTLAQIVDGALHGKAKLTDGDGGRAVFNRLLAFHPSTSYSSVFPTDRRKRARIWYRRFAMVAGRSRQTTSDLIIQLARSTEGIRGRRRFGIFRSAIEAIEGHHELAVRTRGPGRRPIAIDTLTTGGEEETIARYASIDVTAEPVRTIAGRSYPLSSGELSFLRFAALASLYIENGTLLLFDEPETHLHPNFISQFVALLDGLLEQTGSVAILSTHSVYFVREAFEDQVIVLRSDPDRRVIAEIPTLKTFGADVGAISYFVFGEDQPSRLAREVEQKIADTSSSWEEVFDEYKDSLSLELLGDIRARIEDTDREADEP